ESDRTQDRLSPLTANIVSSTKRSSTSSEQGFGRVPGRALGGELGLQARYFVFELIDTFLELVHGQQRQILADFVHAHGSRGIVVVENAHAGASRCPFARAEYIQVRPGSNCGVASRQLRVNVVKSLLQDRDDGWCADDTRHDDRDRYQRAGRAESAETGKTRRPATGPGRDSRSREGRRRQPSRC